MTAQPLHILVVDDEPVSRRLLAAGVERMGHTPLVAAGGADALALFAERRPDLVLTDWVMPDMDGVELTQAIKRAAGRRWTPVLLIASMALEEHLAQSIEAGADDCLVKPVSYPVLRAKVNALARGLSAQRSLEGLNAELSRLKALADAEMRLAEHLLRKVVRLEGGLRDPQVRYWSRPAGRFSGDVVCAARTPSGRLQVLVADATGHGLAASITASLVVPSFYAMTRKGYGIDTIVSEVNSKVNDLLPADRFVAAMLASFDSAQGVLEVWNGGSPSAVLLDEDGRVLRLLAPRHPPLGVLPPGEFDWTPEQVVLDRKADLFVFSDGALEGTGLGGGRRALNRLIAALEASPRVGRLHAAIQAVTRTCRDRKPGDDQLVVRIACAPAASGPALAPRPVDPSANLPDQGSAADKWSLSVRFGPSQLRTLDLAPLMLDLAQRLGTRRGYGPHLFLIVGELVNNALDHGLLGLDSRLKDGSSGMERWLGERSQRLTQLTQGFIEIALEASRHGGETCIRVRVTDSGHGFDHRRLLSELPGAGDGAYHGRGIALVRTLCQELTYRGAGNVVETLFCPDCACCAEN